MITAKLLLTAGNSPHTAGTLEYAAVSLFWPWRMSAQPEADMGALLRQRWGDGQRAIRGSCVKQVRVWDWRIAQFKRNPEALWALSGSWSFVFYSPEGKVLSLGVDRGRNWVCGGVEEEQHVFFISSHRSLAGFCRDLRAVIGFKKW